MHPTQLRASLPETQPEGPCLPLPLSSHPHPMATPVFKAGATHELGQEGSVLLEQWPNIHQH